MPSQSVGAIWIALAVGALTLTQKWLGADMTASLVSAILGAAVVLRDAYAIFISESTQPAGTRGTAPAGPSKIRRFILGS